MSRASGETVLPIKAMASGTAQCACTSTVLTRRPPMTTCRCGAALPDGARRQIDAYVAGVNAFLVTHHGSELPPEFTLLRFEPAPWTGADVLDLARN